MSQALKSVMTGQQPTVRYQDMRPKEQVAYMLQSKKGEIAKMLPSHLNIERLLKIATIAATTTPGLLKCDVPSLVGAIGQCAQMGLEPNTILGEAYLLPFKCKRKDVNGQERWVDSVQVIVGYKGLISLARRSGQIISIAAHEVCENDHFELIYGLEEKLEHRPALDNRGEVIGFYAVAKLKDGGYSFDFMSTKQVNAIMAKTQSKGAYGPWKDHWIEMGRKTAIRRLAKYLPLSIEFQTAAALDNMAEGGKDQHNDDMDGEFSILPDDAPTSQPEANDILDEQTGEIYAVPDDELPFTEPETMIKADRYALGKILVLIGEAKSQEELEAIHVAIAQLDNDAAKTAKTAWTKRFAALKKEAKPDYVDWENKIEACTEKQALIELIDTMSDHEQAKFRAILDERLDYLRD
jgi:recombination protein RecT